MKQKDDHGRNKWHSILGLLGIDDQIIRGKQGPCPSCEGKDRFRFDNKDGRGTWFCNKCGAGDGYKLVMAVRRCTFPEAIEWVREQVGVIKSDPVKRSIDPTRNLNRIWNEARPNTPELHAYFARRGLQSGLADILLTHTKAIRFHPSVAWRQGDLSGVAPAMLAKVFQDGKPITLHRTFLADVPQRKMLMPHAEKLGKLSGCYIPLMPCDTDKRELIVGEGIETVIAFAMHATLLGRALYATVSADHMAKFNPTGWDALYIAGDNDASFTGQACAYALARRAHAGKVPKVEVHIPCDVDTDWADVIHQS